MIKKDRVLTKEALPRTCGKIILIFPTLTILFLLILIIFGKRLKSQEEQITLKPFTAWVINSQANEIPDKNKPQLPLLFNAILIVLSFSGYFILKAILLRNTKGNYCRRKLSLKSRLLKPIASKSLNPLLKFCR